MKKTKAPVPSGPFPRRRETEIHTDRTGATIARFVKKDRTRIGLDHRDRPRVQAHEADGREIGRLHEVVRKQTERLKLLESKIKALSKRKRQERSDVPDGRDQLLGHSEEYEALLYSIQTLQRISSLSGEDASKEIGYQQLISRIRELVRTTLPRDANILVVSKGDADLLKIPGRKGWHFPQSEDGSYAGYYPKNSASAIVHLEALRARGAEYLLFPETAFWWLDHYADFRRYLERRYKVVSDDKSTCRIFALRQPASEGNLRVWSEFEQIMDEFRTRFGREPSILDWNSELGIAAAFPEYTVFSPLTSGKTLPYVDDSLDLVVVQSSDSASLAEGHRVAQTALVTVRPKQAGTQHGPALAVNWKLENTGARPPTVSIVIPCHNGAALTEACLISLRKTLPGNFTGEIVVVDDGCTDDTAVRLKKLAKADIRLKILHNRKNAGYLRSCNRAADTASGEVLVFLNNDTVLLRGWLPPMLQLFRDRPDAGIVGGRLVYPDGRLQEAGGMIFRDGSAAHVGVGDPDIEALSYKFVREVDYCSGALFAIRRSLFEQVGRFDTRYSPAYYEDVDLCFTVRQMGYRVYYQPESTVIHYEGATSGKDLSRGVKRYQAVNQKKFVEKWRDALTRQPVRPPESELTARRTVP